MMELKLLYKNRLEGEAICHLLNRQGHCARIRNMEKIMGAESSSQNSNDVYIMDTFSASRFNETVGNGTALDIKVIITGSLRQLYVLFEANFFQRAYITHKESISEMLKSMESLQVKRIHVSRRVSEFLIKKRIVQQMTLLEIGLNRSLTKTEINLLEQIGRGRTTYEIASEWYRSIHTINNHRKNVIQKLKLGEPVNLAVFAVKNIESIRTLRSLEMHKKHVKGILKNGYR